MDKQKLKDLFYHEGKYCAGKWRNAALCPDIYNLPGNTLAEKIWNGLNDRPLCYCGKQTQWLNANAGYRKYCSCQCRENDISKKPLKEKQHKKLWEDPAWALKTSSKMKDAHFKSRTPKKLALLAEKSIFPLDDIVPGQNNVYKFKHACGEIFTRSFARISSIYCPRCHVSQGQGELFEFIKRHYTGLIIVNDRSAIAPKEIDIYIPALKLGFEFNGKYWHSGDGKREQNKTDYAQQHGIMIVHIWETDWKKDQHLQEELVLKTILDRFR